MLPLGFGGSLVRLALVLRMLRILDTNPGLPPSAEHHRGRNEESDGPPEVGSWKGLASLGKSWPDGSGDHLEGDRRKDRVHQEGGFGWRDIQPPRQLVDEAAVHGVDSLRHDRLDDVGPFVLR